MKSDLEKAKELEKLENDFDASLKKAGDAIKAIKDGKFYIEENFDEYCQNRWGRKIGLLELG